MKLNHILSKMLPEIDDSVKECINLGQWLLFKSSPDLPGSEPSSFYLKAGSNVFVLDENGSIVSELKGDTDDLNIDELFYFSDLPQPKSLSNISMKAFH